MRTSSYLSTLVVATCGSADAFSPGTLPALNRVAPVRIVPARALSSTTTDNILTDYNLTPELAAMTQAFASIPDEKARYKQLMFLASRLPAMDPKLAVPENRVRGCLSTVHISATTVETEDGRKVVRFAGDSDGLLTKGLVALLIRGLSGNTADDIDNIVPDFIKAAGIAQTLTPGRNNGFLNMLAMMKVKARQASNNAAAEVKDKADPVLDEVMGALGKLKPTSITSTNDGLLVVADCFEGLPDALRHQLIGAVLGDIAAKITVLSITAAAPSEV